MMKTAWRILDSERVIPIACIIAFIIMMVFTLYMVAEIAITS
jgi:hypothetical protein